MSFAPDEEDWKVLDLMNLSDADLQVLLLLHTVVLDYEGEGIDISPYIFVITNRDTPIVSDPSAKFRYCIQSRDPMEKCDESHDAESSFWILNSPETPEFLPPFENAYPINLCGARVEETKRHDEDRCVVRENAGVYYTNILRSWSTDDHTGLLTNDDFLNALFAWSFKDFDRSYSRYYDDYSWKPDEWKRCWGKYLKKLEICDGDGLSRGETSTFADATRRISAIVFPKFLSCLVHPKTEEAAILIQRWWKHEIYWNTKHPVGDRIASRGWEEYQSGISS